MHSGTEQPPAPSLRDDAFASLLSALLAYAVGTVLLAIVPPAAPVERRTWVILSICAGVLALVAAVKRSAVFLRCVALLALGIAGVAVGLGYLLYMATTQPRWLLSASALLCIGYAVGGVFALRALRAFADRSRESQDAA
jgi:hypothetical protein